MRVLSKYFFLLSLLFLVSNKVRAEKWSHDPTIHISESMSKKLLEELLFYASVLDIGDSTTIQVRYTLHMPSEKNGLVQYQNTGFGKKRHQVMIWLNRRLSASQQSMTLAHEMIHISQYLKGVLVMKEDNAIWRNKSYDISRTNYRDRPWELEAIERGYELRSRYLTRKNCQKSIRLSIHPLPESL